MVVLAFLTAPPVVRKILAHLRLPAELPVLAPARCPFDEPVLFRDLEPDPPFYDEDLERRNLQAISASPRSTGTPRRKTRRSQAAMSSKYE